jgi:hypothetical protein
MTNRIRVVEAASAPRATRIRLAASIGLVLLAIGLTGCLLIGGLLTRSAQQPAPASAAQAASAAPSTAKGPALSWKDDYGTRHHLTPVKDPVLGWHDFLGTRHAQGLPTTPTLSWKDDYGTRHPDQRP